MIPMHMVPRLCLKKSNVAHGIPSARWNGRLRWASNIIGQVKQVTVTFKSAVPVSTRSKNWGRDPIRASRLNPSTVHDPQVSLIGS